MTTITEAGPLNKSRRVRINVPMIQRSSVLLPGDDGDAHRGIWFYDPTVYGVINKGDTVEFESALTIIQVGIVTDLVPHDSPDYKRFCSGLNSKGFHWKDVLKV